MRSQKTQLTLILCLFSSLALAAGGVGDGGGGQPGNETNPWRIGSAPVQYCIQRDSKFPQSQNELSVLIRESIEDWKNFFKRHRLDQPFSGESETLNSQGLALNFQEVETCTAKTIRFMFGIINKEILEYRTFYPDRVIGFAHRTDYDPHLLSGNGVIWIAPHNSYQENTGPMVDIFPNWTWRPSLKHQLLHEIGHIFGMPHDSTWVMASLTLATDFGARKPHEHQSSSKRPSLCQTTAQR